MAEAPSAVTFVVPEIKLEVEIEIAVAVACDPLIALTDSDELILRTELLDPLRLTDPLADAADLAEEAAGAAPF